MTNTFYWIRIILPWWNFLGFEDVSHRFYWRNFDNITIFSTYQPVFGWHLWYCWQYINITHPGVPRFNGIATLCQSHTALLGISCLSMKLSLTITFVKGVVIRILWYLLKEKKNLPDRVKNYFLQDMLFLAEIPNIPYSKPTNSRSLQPQPDTKPQGLKILHPITTIQKGPFPRDVLLLSLIHFFIFGTFYHF